MCNLNPNGNQLIINGKHWTHKVYMKAIDGHYSDYYIYRILLTADYSN